MFLIIIEEPVTLSGGTGGTELNTATTTNDTIRNNPGTFPYLLTSYIHFCIIIPRLRLISA